MQANELLHQGKLNEALAALQTQVRDAPADPKLRVFLFQLLAVMGRWDKALTQLNVAAEMDAKTLLMAQACRATLECEAFRAGVFAGKRQPMVLGKPQEWVGWLIQAHQLSAEGRTKQSAELRAKAFDAAPATAGTINGASFEWIADADMRLGPMLEAMIDGRYFWVPMNHIREISIEPPADLRDLVWLPARFTWSNGGSVVGFIPTRYAGTENANDAALLLARKTEWLTQGEDLSVGLGQRVLATDSAEFPILEARSVVLDVPLSPDDGAAMNPEAVANG